MKKIRMVAMLIGAALLATKALAAPSVEIVSVQQQYPWTNTVDIVYMVAGVDSETNGYFVVFTPTTSTGESILDVNGEKSVQVALKGSGVYSTQWFPQTNLQYTACKMTPSVYRGAAKDYLIIDLEDWSVSYEPMATQEASNERYNTTEYKTKKIVLRRIGPGTYRIGHATEVSSDNKNSPHDVKVPDGTCYYMGIFPLTVAQYRRVMGTDPSSTNTKPNGSVSWNTLRNGTLTQARIVANAQHPSSFFARLNGLTGQYFDIPTEEMWEIAARADSTTVYYWGDTVDSKTKYCWYNDNGGDVRHDVGLMLPNAWGLYDTSGNIAEWCLDVLDADDLKNKKTDIYTPRPTGTSANYRVRRGGEGYYRDAIKASSRRASLIGGQYGNMGLRISLIQK